MSKRKDGERYRGPGAEPAIELPYQPDADLPPRRTELPVGIDHPAYPVLVGLALFPILMGGSGHHLAEDMPDDETHPFYPDHFWPYPIIAVILGLTFFALAGPNFCVPWPFFGIGTLCGA